MQELQISKEFIYLFGILRIVVQETDLKESSESNISQESHTLNLNLGSRLTNYCPWASELNSGFGVLICKTNS